MVHCSSLYPVARTYINMLGGFNKQVTRSMGENWQKYCDQVRSDGIQATIDVNNEYFAIARNNNKHIVEILTNNYALIDPEDVEFFAEFHTHYLRSETEYDESHRLKLPLEVYTKIGDVYSLKPEFGQLVNRRFMDKKAELEWLLRYRSCAYIYGWISNAMGKKRDRTDITIKAE